MKGMRRLLKPGMLPKNPQQGVMKAQPFLPPEQGVMKAQPTSPLQELLAPKQGSLKEGGADLADVYTQMRLQKMGLGKLGGLLAGKGPGKTPQGMR